MGDEINYFLKSRENKYRRSARHGQRQWKTSSEPYDFDFISQNFAFSQMLTLFFQNVDGQRQKPFS